MKKTLEELRKEIDSADEDLLKILSKRFDIVREIGKLKKEKNIPPLDQKRWDEVIKKIIQKAKKHNLPEQLIIKLYNEIHLTAIEMEKRT